MILQIYLHGLVLTRKYKIYLYIYTAVCMMYAFFPSFLEAFPTHPTMKYLTFRLNVLFIHLSLLFSMTYNLNS